jgi:hypothetical protein
MKAKKKKKTPIEILGYINKLDSFSNAYIAYKILLTIRVTFAFTE